MRQGAGSWLAAIVAGIVLGAGATFGAEVTVDVNAPGGGVTVKSGDNSINFGAWGQFRYTGEDREDFDGDASEGGVGHEDGFSSSFSIPRLRVYMQGTVFRPWIGYRFEYEFSATNSDNANKIKDGYVEVTKVRMAAVRLGQYKVPFSLQELTSDQRQEFLERAITNAKFAVGRDVGAMLWGTTADKRFGYQAGVFNGGGEGRSQDDQKLMSVTRVWTAPFGEYKLSEGPLENSDRFVLEVGAAYRTGEAGRGAAEVGVFEDAEVDDQSAWNVEAAVRIWRLFGTAEYFRMSDEQDDPDPTVRSGGWHAQVGFMAVPQHLEVAVRYALIDPDEGSLDDEVAERRFGVSYYVVGHSLKLMLDAGRVSYASGFAVIPAIAKRGIPALGTRVTSDKVFQDEQVRFQAQLVF